MFNFETGKILKSCANKDYFLPEMLVREPNVGLTR